MHQIIQVKFFISLHEDSFVMLCGCPYLVSEGQIGEGGQAFRPFHRHEKKSRRALVDGLVPARVECCLSIRWHVGLVHVLKTTLGFHCCHVDGFLSACEPNKYTLSAETVRVLYLKGKPSQHLPSLTVLLAIDLKTMA